MARPLRFTPFHVSAFVMLTAGFALAVYHGLAQFGLVPRVGWTSWSHIHFVTIGGFTQLLVGMLPQLTARRLGQPLPSRRYEWGSFLALNGGFLLAWYGRGWGQTWAFDAGLAVIWLLVLSLLVVLLRDALQSDRAWNATNGLYLVAVFVFLWGLTYAYGLFAHVWSVPGGWLGLREAHVHANAWGFLGLAAIGTMYALFPRLLDTDLYSERLRDVSVPFFVAGIFPLITGPWLGFGRTVTATGLVLFATGYGLYVYNLAKTYLTASSRPGIASWLLVSQAWMLGPAGFAPFVLFGVEWVDPMYIENAALHFFFMGWALPIAFAGLFLSARNFPWALNEALTVDGSGGFPVSTVPSVPEGWRLVAWNSAIVLVGVGFFYQDQAFSTWFFALGYVFLGAIWLAALARVLLMRREYRLAAPRVAP